MYSSPPINVYFIESAKSVATTKKALKKKAQDVAEFQKIINKCRKKAVEHKYKNYFIGKDGT